MSISAWERIDNFFKTNPDIQATLKETTDECVKDQCFSAPIIYIATIEKLLARQEGAEQ